MKAKCLCPNKAWLCGCIRSKEDGVISQRMEFNPSEARKYFVFIYGDFGVSEVIRQMKAHEVSVPCGRCAACKIRKRKELSTRLYHEASCFEDDCCFITLTYDDDHVPTTCMNPLKGSAPKMMARGVSELPLQTLLVADVQKFVKRLRRHLDYVPKNIKERMRRDHVSKPIRYFVCGEYGTKYRRPHYHLMIFGWKPSDLSFFQLRNGHPIYRSAQVEKLWKFGFSTVAPVKDGVAAYCAKYVTKKFARLNSDDPFADCVFPEFSLQSVRNGGIGATWFDANYEQILTQGFATVKIRGNYVKQPVPLYYWRRARRKHVCLWLQLRDEKIRFAESQPHAIRGFEELVRKCEVYQAKEKVDAQAELF